MRRIPRLAALLILLGQGPALAQAPDRVYRLGVLGLTVRSLEAVRAVAMPELDKLGFTEGRNLVIEMQAGGPEELPAIARALVGQPC